MTTITIAAVAVSLALSGPVFQLGQWSARMVARSDKTAPAPIAVPAGAQTQSSTARPIILVGLGEVGRRAAEALRAHNVPYVAVEPDFAAYLAAKADDYDVALGDPGDLRLMETLGAGQSGAIVLSQARYDISREVTPIVRERYPHLARFVSVDTNDEAERHAQLGMRPVRNLTTPKGLDLAAELLRFSGVDEAEVAAWMKSAQIRHLEALEMANA